jgi:pentatricopeptide repeat domain-containing protein 1
MHYLLQYCSVTNQLHAHAHFMLHTACHCTVLLTDAQAGQVDEALALLADMQHLGLKPSLITYGSALTACSTAGRGEQALALLQQMQHSSGLLPDARCYSAVISALGKAGMWREALQVLTAMQQPLTLTVVQPLGTTVGTRNGKTEAATTGTGPAAAAAAGTTASAATTSTVSRKGIKPNIVCYTAAITALARAGEARRALQLFSSMQTSGVSPDRLAWNAVLSACEGEGGQWFEALRM